ncbi:hypothetical protein [Methyloligella solikamskensis]|uniref:Uncharacterized protein n=1 Tax=Methyloligella solikamskensis TaxID=1177756 RepID=A0ABW3J657_9HYPH
MEKLYSSEITGMASFLANAEKGDATQQASLLAEYGFKALDAVVNIVKQDYNTILKRGLSGINGEMANELRDKLIEKKELVVADFRHGMLGDQKLKPKSDISVVNAIINSPGAIQQGGVGQFSQHVSQTDLDAFLDALDTFEKAPTVQALNDAERASILDVVETLRDETKKEPKDPARLKRWLDRFTEIATDFGVQVAAGSVVTLGAKMFGV